MSIAAGRQTAADSALVQALRTRLGGEMVESGGMTWNYACAGRVPACVLRPTTVEEVCAAVAAVREEKAAVVVCGNATHLGIGAPPRRYDAALCVSRLDGIVAHNAADMTVVVQAGVTLRALNEHLAESGQWLPLDPAHGEAVTLGGVIAADRNGPRRLAYGKVRDHLLGITVVTADSELAHGGGRVVKNVAGYDLPRLFAGSYGTLGVIVEAAFRLRPRPECERLFTCPAASVRAALECGRALLDAGVDPVLVEALNPLGAESVGAAEGAVLIAGCAGNAAQVDAQQVRVKAAAPEAQVVSDGESTSLLRALAEFPQPLSEDALVARVSVLPDKLGAVLARCEAEAEERCVALEIAAHAGNGVAWCQVAGVRSLDEFEHFADWLRVQARRAGGWAVMEAIPQGLHGRIDPWGFNGSAVALMRGIKEKLDPRGLFSPGRFVGGI